MSGKTVDMEFRARYESGDDGPTTMKYDNIQRATFLTRPNRFVAEVELAGQREIVHVKNTGRCREKVALKRYEAAGGATEGDVNGSTHRSGNSGANADKDFVTLGSSRIDLRRAVVIRNGKETPLKAMEFRLLVYMLKNRNRIIKKDEFFEKVWETEYVGDVTLNVHIRHLREKIEEDPSNPVIIKTVWGTGFILEDKE